eukprot:11895559-Prorocentrum_lima.AAC.1
MEVVCKLTKWRIEVGPKKHQFARFSVEEKVVERAKEVLEVGGFGSRVRCMCRDEKEGAGGAKEGDE